MCPRSNEEKEKNFKITSLPINFAFNINTNRIESINSSALHINDHLDIDRYLDTLTNSNPNSMTDNSTTNNPTKSIFGYNMPVDIFSALVTATVTSGGLFGYFKAGSKPSLFAGLLFGGLLGVGTYMTSVNPNNYYLTLGTSTVLTGVMGTRFIKSGKFMPAGLISALSLSLVVRCVYQMWLSNNNNNK